MTEERLNPEKVLKSFKKLGLKASDGAYFTETKNCACGLGAFYISEVYGDMQSFKETEGDDYQYDDHEYEHISRHFDDLLGTDYRVGFVHGFDGISEKEKEELSYEAKNKEDYLKGYEDGRESRILCEKEGIYL